MSTTIRNTFTKIFNSNKIFLYFVSNSIKDITRDYINSVFLKYMFYLFCCVFDMNVKFRQLQKSSAMVIKCRVKGCTSNYQGHASAAVFKLPEDKELKQRYI